MFKLTLFLVFVRGYYLMFHQDGYKVIFDRIEIDWYNTSIVKDLKLYLFRYNRSIETKLLNSSFYLKIDTPKHIWAHTQIYKFASMEYRLFAVNFTIDICASIVKKEMFGAEDIWNTTNAKCCCPFKKGPYHVTNYMIDYTKWPPHAPTGMFMSSLRVFINNTVDVLKTRHYFTIESIIRWF